MKPPAAGTKNKQQQAMEREEKRRLENARKAKEAADKLFPGEKWQKKEEGIYQSPRRKQSRSYEDEFNVAKILRDLGSTVYLVPESSRQVGKKYDAIVNGLMFEFKNVGGNANTLEHQFLRSRSQAPNVFINLEKSELTRREVMSALYGARNKTETEQAHGYAHYNKFKGGRVILKIKGLFRLVYLNIDDLKIPQK
jgi:hypothetical protein